MKPLFIAILTLFLVACGGATEFSTVDDEPAEVIPPVERVCDMTAAEAHDGWSKSGKLLTGSIVGSDGNGGQTSKTLNLQVDFNEANGGPGSQYYTVQFDTEPSPSKLSSAKARVTWSVGGNDVTRIIDVVKGAVISGTASAVKVEVYDDTPAIVIATVGNELYSVDILVTPGCRPSEQQPPRFSPPVAGFLNGSFLVPGASFSSIIEIPRDAGAISVFTTAIKAANGAIARGDVVVYFAPATLPTYSGGYDVVDGLGSWIAIPPISSRLIIQNTSVDPVIVSLTFGIEG